MKHFCFISNSLIGSAELPAPVKEQQVSSLSAKY